MTNKVGVCNMISIKKINGNKCSSCNASGADSHLWEISVSSSNTIQGSTLYYRLCDDCSSEMIHLLAINRYKGELGRNEE